MLCPVHSGAANEVVARGASRFARRRLSRSSLAPIASAWAIIMSNFSGGTTSSHSNQASSGGKSSTWYTWPSASKAFSIWVRWSTVIRPRSSAAMAVS